MSYIGSTPTSQNFIAGTDYFNGTGSTTAFTLTRTVNSVNDIQAVVNNVVQVPNDAYTISGTTITFTSAPSAGTSNVYVRYLSTTTQSISPSQGTVGTAQLGTITNIASGNSSLTLQTGSTPTTAVTVDTSQNVTIPANTYLATSSGSVGIGTTSPQSKVGVNVALTDTKGVVLQYNGEAKGGILLNPTSGEFRTGSINTTGSYFTTLYANNAERVRINSDGNLLVGTTASISSGLTSISYSGASATGANGLIISESANTTSTTFLGFNNGTSNIGNVARVGATSAVVYNTTSDLRLKSNIADANLVLDKLMDVKVRQFDWTEGDLHQDAGFIAQELEPVLSGIVTKGKTEEDMWQMDYSRLTPYLVKAIQELNAKVEAQAATIATLQARLPAENT
jgi:hypothetical protein